MYACMHASMYLFMYVRSTDRAGRVVCKCWPSSQLSCFFPLGQAVGTACMAIAFRFARRMYLVCWATCAAYHYLHLLPESLVEQSIYKRINGRVEQDHCESNGICNIVGLVGGAVVTQDVDKPVSQPTDCKDGTDDNNHQCDSLPHLHHALKIKEAMSGL